MEYEGKTRWDYFCQLMTAVPGLSAVFSDEYLREGGDMLPRRGEKSGDGYRHSEGEKRDSRDDRGR